MGIRFECLHCGHSLHVKDFLAGKRGICPHCQGRIEIPNRPGAESLADDMVATTIEIHDEPHFSEATTASPTSVAAATAAPTLGDDPIAEDPQLNWYVLPAGSITKFGPAPGELMRTWLNEGRVPADALVWREGWAQWRAAAGVFPRLTASANGPPQVPAEQTRAALAIVEDTSSAPAVVLDLDDRMSSSDSERRAVRRPSARRVRNQQNLTVGLLAALVAILLPILIYVLLHQ